MSIEGQGHFFTIYFPGSVCFVLNYSKISGGRLQDHWSSGFLFMTPSLKKSREHISFDLSIRPSVFLSVRSKNIKARVLKFH